MALADLHRCKRYLGIRPATTAKDGLISELLLSAKAMIETYLAKLSRDMATASTGGTWSAVPSFRGGGIVTGGSVTVITLTTITLLPDYLTRIEPQLNQDIVDTVAHLYRNRSPNAASETEGGGISDSWDDVGESGLPKRVERRMRGLVETIEA